MHIDRELLYLSPKKDLRGLHHQHRSAGCRCDFQGRGQQLANHEQGCARGARRCAHSGCDVVGTLRELAAHEAVCPHKA